MKYLAHRVSSTLLLTFGLSFGALLLLLLYAGFFESTSFDLRSKAAVETMVYKQWEFLNKNQEGWTIHSANPVGMGGDKGEISLVVDHAGATLENTTVQTALPTGKKMLRLTTKMSTPTQTVGHTVQTPAVQGTIEYQLVGKHTWEDSISFVLPSASAYSPVDIVIPHHTAIFVSGLRIHLTSPAVSQQVGIDSIALVAPQFIPTPTPTSAPPIVLKKGYYEENTPGLAFMGAWTIHDNTHVSGGHFYQTNDLHASLQFVFEGTHLILYRKVQEGIGSVSVCIDSTCQTVTLTHEGSTTLVNMVVPKGVHTVVINNLSTHAISIDAVKIDTDNPIKTQ